MLNVIGLPTSHLLKSKVRQVMRDDLLGAQAVIDWALSDLPILQRKIFAWRDSAPYPVIIDTVSQQGKKLFRLADVKPIPGIINAEAGVALHAIRSSLDLLAVALAERNGHSASKDTYFPIARSKDDFFREKGARRKIRLLGAANIQTIESLQPWKGGDDLLAEMHYLDIRRKHQRLLAAFAAPHRIIVAPPAFAHSTYDFADPWPGMHDDAIVATGKADAPEGDFVISLDVRFAEAGLASKKGVVALLCDYARLVQSIIGRFDGPDC